MKVYSFRRLGAGLVAASLLALALSVPATAAPSGGTSKSVSVFGVAEGVLASFTISAGESAPISVRITNNGKQTLNNVRLLLGQDDNPLPAPNGDATPPTTFPTGVTIATSTAGCTGGAILDCSLGTLGARTSVTVSAVVNTTEDTPAAPTFLTEGVVSVAESGNDNGSNIDTFSAQGTITILGFSCESVSAYRPGNSSKEVSTCALGDEDNANGQSAKVKLPANLAVVTLSENAGAACPVVGTLDCIGQEVEANVQGDTTGDVITWTIQIQLNGQNVTLNKLVVVHTADDGTTTTEISLARKNACKTAGSTNCGSASVSGDVLTITVQTPGNGKTRLLG
ncbi:MAG: hypothetical protein AB1627_01930 [Chloroflexota bacterium]